MIDSSSDAILAELDRKSRRMRLWPIVAVLATVVALLLIVFKASAWLMVPWFVLSALGVFVAYQFDLWSKTVVVLYDLDADVHNACSQLQHGLLQLANCAGTWRIDARGSVYNPKYHGGAGQLVQRRRISIGVRQPAYVRTNIQVPFLPTGRNTLYFFPERILTVGPDGVGAMRYDDLSIIVNDKRFIEDEAVPRDAQVVDHTWRYVNKNGGPDRRFSNNRQIPVCLYEELWFSSPHGLNEVIQISRTGIGEKLDAAFQNIADVLGKAALARPPVRQSPPPASTPHAGVQQPQTTSVADRDQIFRILLEVLCCLMVADGRASTSEKGRIREVMARLQSPWTDCEVDDRMLKFIDRVQQDGNRKTLASALQNVAVFKQVGKQALLLQCLEAVAAADEKMDDRETQLWHRVKAIVE